MQSVRLDADRDIQIPFSSLYFSGGSRKKYLGGLALHHLGGNRG